MKSKNFEALVKALEADGGEPGTFSAVVAVFDNVDKVGDRLKAQAFDNTLKAWRDSGNPIPIVFAHGWDDPWQHIGYADPADVKAVPGRGLVVSKGVLDIEDNPVAKQVHKLMKRGTITEFSFGYSVPAGGEKKASDGAYDLTEVNLFEFGPCLKGVNPDTELLEVKAAVHERATAHAPQFKSYVDVDVPGSFEERVDSVRSALRDAYPNTDPAEWVNVNVVATTAADVTYQLCSDGPQDDAMFQASYEVDEAGVVTLGEATPVEMAIVPKADEDIEVKADETEVEVKAVEVPEEDGATILAKTELFLAQERLKVYAAFAGTHEPGYLDTAHDAQRFQAELDALGD